MGGGPPKLRRDSAILFSAEVIQFTFGMIIVALLVRNLEQSVYGTWIGIIAVFQLFNFVNFGFPTFINRNIPNNPGLLRDVYSKIRQLQYLLFVITSIVVIFILFTIETQNRAYFRYLLALATVSLIFTQINLSIFNTIGKAYRNIQVALIDRSITLLLVVSVIEFYDGSEELFVIAFGTGPVVGLIFSQYFVIKEINGIDPQKTMSYSRSSIVKESAPFSFNLIFGPVFDSVNKLTLSFFGGPATLAIFDVSNRVLMAGNSVTRSLRKIMLPVISHNKSNHDEISRHLKDSITLVKWILPVGLFFGHLAGMAIPIVFSGIYTESTHIFYLLLISFCLMLINSPWISYIESVREPSFSGYMTVFCYTSAIVTCMLLVPKYGIYGAAISLISVQLFYSIFCIMISYRIAVIGITLASYLTMISASILYPCCIFVISYEKLPLNVNLIPLVSLLAICAASGWKIDGFKEKM